MENNNIDVQIEQTKVPILKRKSFWRKVLSVFIILAGLLAGAWVGFMISFSACFKSACSPLESSAPLTIPLATLLATVPFVKWLNRNEKGALKRVLLISIGIPVVLIAFLFLLEMLNINF